MIATAAAGGQPHLTAQSATAAAAAGHEDGEDHNSDDDRLGAAATRQLPPSEKWCLTSAHSFLCTHALHCMQHEPCFCCLLYACTHTHTCCLTRLHLLSPCLTPVALRAHALPTMHAPTAAPAPPLSSDQQGRHTPILSPRAFLRHGRILWQGNLTAHTSCHGLH